MAVFHSIPGSIPPPVDVICGPLAIDNLCTKTYNPVHVIPGSKQNGEALWRIVQSELHTTKKVRLRYNTVCTFRNLQLYLVILTVLMYKRIGVVLRAQKKKQKDVII